MLTISAPALSVDCCPDCGSPANGESPIRSSCPRCKQSRLTGYCERCDSFFEFQVDGECRCNKES